MRELLTQCIDIKLTTCLKCCAYLRHNIEERIPRVEQTNPQLPQYSSSEGKVGNENGYR